MGNQLVLGPQSFDNSTCASEDERAAQLQSIFEAMGNPGPDPGPGPDGTTPQGVPVDMSFSARVCLTENYGATTAGEAAGEFVDEFWNTISGLDSIQVPDPTRRIYHTGTITISSGVVAGSGTTFPAEWSAAGSLTIGGATYTVASYSSGTSITLNDTSVNVGSAASSWLLREDAGSLEGTGNGSCGSVNIRLKPDTSDTGDTGGGTNVQIFEVAPNELNQFLVGGSSSSSSNNVIKAKVNNTGGVAIIDATFAFDAGVALLGTVAVTGTVKNYPAAAYYDNQDLVLIQDVGGNWYPVNRDNEILTGTADAVTLPNEDVVVTLAKTSLPVTVENITGRTLWKDSEVSVLGDKAVASDSSDLIVGVASQDVPVDYGDFSSVGGAGGILSYYYYDGTGATGYTLHDDFDLLKVVKSGDSVMLAARGNEFFVVGIDPVYTQDEFITEITSLAVTGGNLVLTYKKRNVWVANPDAESVAQTVTAATTTC